MENNNNAEEFYNRMDVNSVKVARKVATEHKLIHSGNKYYEFRNGYYREIESSDARAYVRLIVGDQPNSYKIKDILDELKNICHVKAADLNKSELLNVKNGMLDVATLTLTLHDPSFYSTVQLDVNFDEKAQCPKWEKTLNEIFEGDQKKVALLQEFFGVCFTKITKYQSALFCVGKGENGKSTLIEVLQYIIGKENYSAVALESFHNRHYLANLYGKLLNVSPETKVKISMEDSTFKAIVTGDAIHADEKFERGFTFHPFCKLLFALNAMPRVDDKSDAFYRRLLILRFEKRYVRGKRNTNLKEELLQERDGVFLWALKGYQRLVERGEFEVSEEIENEILEYRKENNHILIFIEEECQIKPGLSVPKGELFCVYQRWCQDNGLHALSSINFSKELRNQYPLIQANRDSDKWFWINIDLLTKTPVNPAN